ncbi:MAG TPA: SusC/RagA family TonB-linked outer membrane protein [Puia sp.]|nr:SusC/RagA family TonB-linked outer membrane protein [Puia sp.]
MKLTFILLIAAILQANAGGWAQNISLSQKNASLENVFAAIEKQTGYSFLFEKALLQQANKVDIQVTNAPIEKVLDICFKDQPLTYKIFEKTIVVRKKEATLPPVAVEAPPIDLSGHITDADGNPLEGATIRVAGAKMSAITDSRGDFLLRGIDGNAVLEISFVGFKTQTVHVSGRQTISIGLALSNSRLDQTVIIGYGTTSKRYNTGSVVKITSEDIEKQPVANVMQALQGLVLGLEVVQTNGYASAQFHTVIRGKKDLFSSNSPNNPLFIVDGVPLVTSNGDLNNAGLNQNGFLGTNAGQSPLYSINPFDIESIEVLKDADATAIYGSRGANGVILITTKKGKPGVSRLDINAYTGVTSRPSKVKLLDTKQYIAMRREAFANDGITPDASNAPDLTLWDTTRHTDWQQKLASASKTSDIELGYSGGDDYNNFRFSGGFHRQTPPAPDWSPSRFKDQRLSGQFSYTHSSKDKRFTSTLMTNYASTSTQLPGYDFYKFLLPPNAPSILDSTGKLNWKDWSSTYDLQNMFSGFAGLFKSYNSNTNNLVTNLALSYRLTTGLTISASLGYTNTTMDQLQTTPTSLQGYNLDPAYYPSYTGFGTNNFKSWIVEPRATYTTRIGDGNLQLMAGGTMQENITTGTNITASGFANESLLEDMASAANVYVNSSIYKQYRFQGYFARANYNWKGKYILNLSGRRDGSSRFKAGNQMGNFGSAGAAWIFSEESFLKNKSSFLSFGKLRGSYGTTGSNSSSDYAYISAWGASGNYAGVSALTLFNPYNPGYQWQVNKKLESAMELGFLNDRIFLTLSWYRERMGNELVNYPLPVYTGFSIVTANLNALVQNQGWELMLNTTNVESKNVSWTTNFNISINRNKLLSFPNLENSSYSDNYVVGQPVTIQKLLHYTGLDPATGKYTFLDADHNGIIQAYVYGSNVNDRVGTYDAAPDFFGGITNNIRYKQWQLSFLFEFKKQRGPYSTANGVPGSMQNQPVSVLGRWQKAGDITSIHKFTTNQNYDADIYNYNNSDANIVDASYIRMQNLSLSYNLPESLLRKAAIKGCRIYFQGQNLFTITGYKGMDPSNPSLSVYSFPPLKTFTGGIQFTL